MHFDLSLEEEINICHLADLTPTELFVLRLLFLAIDGDQKLLNNYLSGLSNGKQLLRQVLASLIDKGVINKTFKLPNPGESLQLKTIPINKNFMKSYIREANIIGKEFFDTYPSFITINGKLVSIRNFTRAGLYSFEEFCLFYAKSIKNSAVKHEYILEILEYAKENNLIHYSILEFLASQKWIEIEYIRNSGDVNGYNNTELL